MIAIATLTIIIQIIINVFSYMIIHIIVKPIIKMINNMLSIFLTKCKILSCSRVDLFHIQWYYIIVERKIKSKGAKNGIPVGGVPFFLFVVVSIPFHRVFYNLSEFITLNH